MQTSGIGFRGVTSSFISIASSEEVERIEKEFFDFLVSGSAYELIGNIYDLSSAIEIRPENGPLLLATLIELALEPV